MRHQRIAVVDYGAGNLQSVATALQYLGANFFITSLPLELAQAEKLIFPGVGEAASAMQNLKENGLDEGISNFFKSGRLILGICLGSQIVLDSSEESSTLCLGLISGRVRRFIAKPGFKVPHMGWNTVKFIQHHPIFRDIPDNSSFYFVHSYYPEPEDQANVMAVCDYISPFPCAVGKDNLMAVQFHPEKSGRYGLRLLKNFIEL